MVRFIPCRARLSACLSLIALFYLLTQVVAAQAQTAQWPFDQPRLSELRQSPRKVFAHYFSPYPISLDNKPPEKDYYTNGFLLPTGENGKHQGYGGFFRQRPLPRAPRPEADWVLEDLGDEIRLARDLGIDGFCFDILDISSKRWAQLLKMLDAVPRTDKEFKIVLMPDMEAEYKRKPEELVPSIMKIADHSALYRLQDGRLVIAPYNAQRQNPEYWKATLREFERNGVKVALVPLFQGWWNFVEDYREFSFGFSDWGTSTFDEENTFRYPKHVNYDRKGLLLMAPVRPQDFRPKGYHGSESRNSALFREMWRTAMDSKAQWVQIITWNDYSETSEIAPSTRTGYTFYDLSAYYTTWFKTGQPPAITRDALYYFHRIQPVNATVDLNQQKRKFTMKGQPSDEIELLGFLTAPGRLEITIAGTTHTKDCPAGINSLSIPLVNGRPRFTLRREGQIILEVTSNWEISDQVVYDNLMVHAGGGTAEALLRRSPNAGSAVQP